MQLTEIEKTEFRAFVVEERDDRYSGELQRRRVADLPSGDLLVRVFYSSLNYKDALSASGNRGVTKEYPHTPGIDAVGMVEKSGSNDFLEGDPVIVTGFDLGMNTPGGFGQYIRVPSRWALRLPDGLSMQEAMAFGTAGLTAALSVLRLTETLKPEDGRIAVSGATGGVGALAVAMLSKLGYCVSAISGKEQERDFLLNLGAAEVLPRKDFQDEERRPLHKGVFAGAVDTVGGTILVNLLKSMQPMGVVTCCGNVASPELHLTVYPFILRGVSLIGIDSQNCPIALRKNVWCKLAGEWKPDCLMNLSKEISMSDLPDSIERMLQGKLKGRTVVNLNA
ncbi:MAG: YhdH/YhfP family quinone oxidoreductase [Prosthecochloris sp.]|uniref:YhdH/YhfP family quinone oxidoreductase n=1 Tax=Prosthecochloris sp. TaxID=290513 RepID=UPI0025870E4E|nr:YhdH/YhfP family quinone oxidoreductase [Prosthecochloris sp.]MCW8797819.1 YhdH/YhfP family quinone oxidoreductase [Prosthecochloris sp.]